MHEQCGEKQIYTYTRNPYLFMFVLLATMGSTRVEGHTQDVVNAFVWFCRIAFQVSGCSDQRLTNMHMCFLKCRLVLFSKRPRMLPTISHVSIGVESCVSLDPARTSWTHPLPLPGPKSWERTGPMVPRGPGVYTVAHGSWCIYRKPPPSQM